MAGTEITLAIHRFGRFIPHTKNVGVKIKWYRVFGRDGIVSKERVYLRWPQKN